jgi:hypothetical protein
MPDEPKATSFAVLAMLRDGLTERIVALNPNEAAAREVARKVAAVMTKEFVRCRVRQVHMTAGEIEALVFEWGRLDALGGEPLHKTGLPKLYVAAYRHGYRVGRAGTREAPRQSEEPKDDAGSER